MGTITTLTLADGQATPASHVFTPYTGQKGSNPATWFNREAVSPIGFRKVTLSVDFNQTGTSKIRAVISDPVLASVAAGCCVDQNTPQVAYTDFADITFKIPMGATLQNRKDILAYAKNFLASSAMATAIENLEPAY